MNSVDPTFQMAVRDLLTGKSASVEIDDEGIDLSDLNVLNTALIALVHLGYLAYEDGTVRIPNQEVMEEFLRILGQVQRKSCV